MMRWLMAVGSLFIVFMGMLAVSIPVSTVDAQGFATNTPRADEVTISTQVAPAQSTLIPTQTQIAEPVSPPAELSYPPECEYVPGQTINAACRAFIDASPSPDIDPIALDGYTLDNYAFWRVGPSPVDKYNAPNGTITATIPQGYNFVNAQDSTSVPGWIQIEGGDWIQDTTAEYTQASYLTGARISEDWQLPFAIILDTTGLYASSIPGQDQDPESGLVMLRYQRYNIYAETYDDEGWRWYMVGPDQWIKQTFVSVVKTVDRPEGVTGRWVAVDLYEQNLVAYEDNKPVFATLVSSGVAGNDTNEGVFQVWARLSRDAMSGATGAPDAYDLQSVPWTMYFDGDISLHGTYWHDIFGYRTSHGCVNLSISDARWVYEWTGQDTPNENGDIDSFVYVHSSGEYR
ncbi:MAG: L,D-transpeptidase [Aggregatilineales bacterium]